MTTTARSCYSANTSISLTRKSPTCIGCRSIQSGHGSSGREWHSRRPSSRTLLSDRPRAGEEAAVRKHMTSVEHQPTGEELMAYLDGEVTPETATGIQSHLASCAVCQHIVVDLKSASAELERWHVEDPPPSLRLPPPPEPRASWFAILRFKPAMAWSLVAGLTVVGLAMMVFTRPAPRPAVFAGSVARTQTVPALPERG